MYFTLTPLSIYEQISNVIYDDVKSNTNDFLNKKAISDDYVVFSNQYSIYKTIGLVTYNSLINTLTLKLNNNSYSFNIDNDREKIILLLLSAKKN